MTTVNDLKYLQNMNNIIDSSKNRNLNYYLNSSWTYTIEIETHKGSSYYIIRVNELPGICTDSESLEEGMCQIKELIVNAIEIYKIKGESIPESKM